MRGWGILVARRAGRAIGLFVRGGRGVCVFLFFSVLGFGFGFGSCCLTSVCFARFYYVCGGEKEMLLILDHHRCRIPPSDLRPRRPLLHHPPRILLQDARPHHPEPPGHGHGHPVPQRHLLPLARAEGGGGGCDEEGPGAVVEAGRHLHRDPRGWSLVGRRGLPPAVSAQQPGRVRVSGALYEEVSRSEVMDGMCT